MRSVACSGGSKVGSAFAVFLAAAVTLALQPYAGASEAERQSSALPPPACQDGDAAAWTTTAAPPLSEAFHEQPPPQASANSLGWKPWVLAIAEGHSFVVRRARSLRCRNAFTPVSPRRTLEILYCTWQV